MGAIAGRGGGKGLSPALSSGLLSANKGPTRFNVPFRRPPRYRISGVTRTSAGVALGGVSIEVYMRVTNIQTGQEPKGQLVGMTTSDANGNYTVDVHFDPDCTYQVDAYLSGSPDVAGTTVNTLVGTPE